MVVVFVLCGVVYPVTDPTGNDDAVHVKFPPATSGFNVMLNVDPEQIGAGALLVRCGVGFTVTVRSDAGPLQPLA